MSIMKTTAWITTLALGAVAFVACGDSTGDGSSSDDGSSESTSSSTSSSFECCLNGAGYTCPNQAAFDKCGGSGADVNECLANCQGAPGCAEDCQALDTGGPDPSDCDADDSVDCSSSDDDDGGDCSGTAIPCDLDLDCCEGLTCEPRDDGQPGGSCQ